MKRILITGKGSFVGDSVREYLSKWPDDYRVETVSTERDEWRSADLSGFDTVFHVAGIAHSDTGDLTEEQRSRYYTVNTDLTLDVARKAKTEGVKQFIFMSSSIVYGDSAPIGKSRIISKETPCQPANCYGDSKLKAENGLSELEDDSFRVVLLRCPMIYGRGGKGNYPKLVKLALTLPLFPKVGNFRSMLYINNLAEFVRLMIDHEERGIFWPCNREWTNTTELVTMIAACHGKKIIVVPGLVWLLKLLSKATPDVDKAFGNLTYEEHLGDYKEEYRLYTLAESVKETEA